jgi:nitrogen fixation protein FixH
MTTISDPMRRGRRELTGFAVLLWLLAFFATVAAANATLVHYAVTTFGGVETDNAYAAGLKFQQDIQAAAAQEAAGWRVATELGRLDGAETEIRLHPVDSRGMALGGLGIDGRLQHPTDRRLDEALHFTETTPGLYIARATPAMGQWELVVELSQGGERRFRSENRIRLR